MTKITSLIDFSLTKMKNHEKMSLNELRIYVKHLLSMIHTLQEQLRRTS